MPEGGFRHFLLQNRPEVQVAPLRSPDPPACFVTASAQAPVAGEGAFASIRTVGARAVLSARAPRVGFFRPASPLLARLYSFESAVHRVVGFVRVRCSMPWLIHLARPSSWSLWPEPRLSCWPFPPELAARCSAPFVWAPPVALLSFSGPRPPRSFVCPNPPPVKLAPFIRTPSFARLRPPGPRWPSTHL